MLSYKYLNPKHPIQRQMASDREKFKTYKDVFDEFTLRNLFKVSSQGHFDDLLSPVALGKEANIFTAKKGSQTVIVKIYRLETSDFIRMYRYITGDIRFSGLRKNRRKIIFAWAQREYRNLLKARELGMNVPMPIACIMNINVMSMVGDSEPAQKLKDSEPEDPNAFYDELMKNMLLFHKAGFVHGDLSEYNILNYNEKPYVIDLSHATTDKSPLFPELLERDLKNVIRYFTKLGVKIDKKKLRKRFSLE